MSEPVTKVNDSIAAKLSDEQLKQVQMMAEEIKAHCTRMGLGGNLGVLVLLIDHDAKTTNMRACNVGSPEIAYANLHRLANVILGVGGPPPPQTAHDNRIAVPNGIRLQ